MPRKLLGDCRQTLKTLPEKSVHLCVTSPPYWGLRSYLPAGHPLKPLEIGSEPTMELYIQHLLECFREVWRVLRDDGTLWVNCGDSYGRGDRPNNPNDRNRGTGIHTEMTGKDAYGASGALLKPKDLCMMPARVAMALQSEGWYLRSVIPWLKRNAMPESVTDRPATAVEYVFMFSKSERYFYDRYAVMQPSSDNTHPRTGRDGSFKGNETVNHMRSEAASQFPASALRDGTRRRRPPAVNPKTDHAEKGTKQNASFAAGCSQYIVGQRNRRNSDWFMESWQGLLQDDEGDPLALVVNPVGTRIKHFASYPPKLIEPIIKAGTSAKGCCQKCESQWERVIMLGLPDREHQRRCGGDDSGEYHGRNQKLYQEHKAQSASTVKERVLAGMREKKTTGWKPTCDCGYLETIPCTVLDPFWGTGCTGMVSTALGRRSIGCELNPEYFKDSDIRDAQGALAIL